MHGSDRAWYKKHITGGLLKLKHKVWSHKYGDMGMPQAIVLLHLYIHHSWHGATLDPRQHLSVAEHRQATPAQWGLLRTKANSAPALHSPRAWLTLSQNWGSSHTILFLFCSPLTSVWPALQSKSSRSLLLLALSLFNLHRQLLLTHLIPSILAFALPRIY